MEKHMSEPQITCPNCKTEIKLTESLAAPLIAETRKNLEQQLVMVGGINMDRFRRVSRL